jgi:NAD(P)-dependent dehydrogenase (short-subunit alcohol dehydrogenase family)
MKQTSTSKVALVTGGARRLGRKIAVALAEQGFDVAVNYYTSGADARETVKTITALGRRAIAVRADVSRRRDVEKLFGRTIKTFGRLDVLINNAAILPAPREVTALIEKEWRRVIDTNLTGSFFCAQAAAKIMIRQKSGQIINIASIGALRSWRRYLAYNVSKAGVVMMTRTLARALAPDISVNAVAPGTIIIPGEETGKDHEPPVERIPQQKYGKPSDITDIIIFLVTSAEYITGQVISVDGGLSIT